MLPSITMFKGRDPKTPIKISQIQRFQLRRAENFPEIINTLSSSKWIFCTLTVQKQAEILQKKKKAKCLTKSYQTHFATSRNVPNMYELWLGTERDKKAGGAATKLFGLNRDNLSL